MWDCNSSPGCVTIPLIWINVGFIMAGKKYISDYILEDRADSKTGRIRSVAVYRGAWYAFVCDEKQLKKTKKHFSVLTLLCVPAFFIPLCVNAPCCHVWYTLFPFVGMLFPVFYLLRAWIRLLMAKDCVTREHRDKLTNRYSAVSMVLTLFAVAELIALAVYGLRVGLSWSDGIYALCALTVGGCALAMFLRRKELAMRELPPKT